MSHFLSKQYFGFHWSCSSLRYHNSGVHQEAKERERKRTLSITSAWVKVCECAWLTLRSVWSDFVLWSHPGEAIRPSMSQTKVGFHGLGLKVLLGMSSMQIPLQRRCYTEDKKTWIKGALLFVISPHIFFFLMLIFLSLWQIFSSWMNLKCGMMN